MHIYKISRYCKVCLHWETFPPKHWIQFGLLSLFDSQPSLYQIIERIVLTFVWLLDACARHGVEKSIPIEQLVKCRMQDNLDFLQWTKRYWDQNFPGHEYDAVARRKGAGTPGLATSSTSRTSTNQHHSSNNSHTPAAHSTRKTPTSAAASNRATPRYGGGAGAGAGAGGGAGAAAAALRSENETLKEAIGGLEKERDFYFSKLRDIELLLQNAVDQDPKLEKDEDGLVKNIQAILYSTEEGFEIPAEAEEAAAGGSVDFGGGGGVGTRDIEGDEGEYAIGENADEQETF